MVGGVGRDNRMAAENKTHKEGEWGLMLDAWGGNIVLRLVQQLALVHVQHEAVWWQRFHVSLCIC